MMYESDEDRLHEARVLNRLEHVFGQMFGQAEFGSFYDAESPDYLVEVKCRTNPVGRYPFLNIDRAKIDRLLRRADNLGKEALLVVEWSDDTRWINLSRMRHPRPARPFGLSQMRRRDRDGERPDVVYMINIDLFESVNRP